MTFSLPVNFLVEALKPKMALLKTTSVRYLRVSNEDYPFIVRFVAFAIGSFLAWTFPEVIENTPFVNQVKIIPPEIIVGVFLGLGSNQWHNVGKLFNTVNEFLKPKV